MATRKTASNIVETTQPESAPMFIVIDRSNSFDPINTQEFATVEEAEEKVIELLQANPMRVLITAKLLKTFKAKVQVSGEDFGTA